MKGKNEDFLTRTLKYALRQKWPALLKAFRTAAAKVGTVAHATAQPCMYCPHAASCSMLCHLTVKALIHSAHQHHMRHCRRNV